MLSPKEVYEIRIGIISQKVLDLHKEFKKPIADICDDVKVDAVSMKYRNPHQQRLNFMEE